MIPIDVPIQTCLCNKFNVQFSCCHKASGEKGENLINLKIAAFNKLIIHNFKSIGIHLQHWINWRRFFENGDFNNNTFLRKLISNNLIIEGNI